VGGGSAKAFRVVPQNPERSFGMFKCCIYFYRFTYIIILNHEYGVMFKNMFCSF
jgi:hypothetical protein